MLWCSTSETGFEAKLESRSSKGSVVSRYHDVMAGRQTTLRLPEALAVETEAVARVRGISVNSLIIDVLEAEMTRVRNDKRFAAKAKELLERDRELLERLAH